MANPLTKYPHIYKKGRIINFKRLNESKTLNDQYCFGGNTANLTILLNSTNNINQVLGRVWLGVCKLASYFGISKNPSEKLSKDSNVFNQAKHGDNKILEEIKILFEKQDSKLKDLEQRIKELQKPNSEKPINRNEVLDFTNRLKDIQTSLKAVLGE